jgi:hypothetical protein
MAGMVSHAGQPLDHGGHPRQGPQIRAEAVGACPLAKPALEALQLRAVQSGWATGSADGSQGGQAALLPGAVPATGTLAAYLECPGHKGRSLAATEELRGLPAPLFQGLEISSGTHHCFHASNISEVLRIVTLFCEVQ